MEKKVLATGAVKLLDVFHGEIEGGRQSWKSAVDGYLALIQVKGKCAGYLLHTNRSAGKIDDISDWLARRSGCLAIQSAAVAARGKGSAISGNKKCIAGRSLTRQRKGNTLSAIGIRVFAPLSKSIERPLRCRVFLGLCLWLCLIDLSAFRFCSRPTCNAPRVSIGGVFRRGTVTENVTLSHPRE